MIVKAGNETVYDSSSARKFMHAVTRIWNPLRFWTVTDSFRHFLSYPPYPRSKGLTGFWAGLLTYLLIRNLPDHQGQWRLLQSRG